MGNGECEGLAEKEEEEKMRRRRLLLLLSVIVFLSSCALAKLKTSESPLSDEALFSQTLPEEIDGFRGVEFGTYLSDFNYSKIVGTKDFCGEQWTLVIKENDNLSFQNIRLDGIHYFFMNGKFFGVLMKSTTEPFGSEHWDQLKDKALELYGETSILSAGIDYDWYQWNSNGKIVRLKRNIRRYRGKMVQGYHIGIFNYGSREKLFALMECEEFVETQGSGFERKLF